MSVEFGIKKNEMGILLGIFNTCPEIRNISVYGSRAKGTYGDLSDLDLVIMDAVDRKTLGKLWMDINYSDFPFVVDLLIFDEIRNQNLIDHIQRVGKTIYTKDVKTVLG